MNAVTPPGWYPVEGGGLRYWDGARWTEHTAAGAPTPMAAASSATATSATPRSWFVRHKVLTGVLAVVLLIGVVGAVGGDGTELEPAAES